MYPARSRSSDDRGGSSETKNGGRNNSSIFTRQSIILIVSTGYVGFIIIIAHHWLKLSHLHTFASRGENRLSRVYPASLRILMIYLAHSKTPSNEISSRRVQSSANSGIERTFRPQEPKQQWTFLFFRWINHLLFEQSLLWTAQSPLNSISNGALSELENLLTGDGCTCRSSPDRRAKANPAKFIKHSQCNTWSIVKNETRENVTTLTITIIITSKRKEKRRRYFYPPSQQY